MANTEKTKQPFSLEQAGESFAMAGGHSVASGGDQPITLNIAEVTLVKQLMDQERLAFGKLSGNPIIDLFYRLNDWLISHSATPLKEKAAFFRLLSVMLNAGIPLIRSLDTLAAQTTHAPKLSGIISKIKQDVEHGTSLSDAMAKHPDIFDDAQVGMTKSGEATGQLNHVLSGLANRLEQSSSIRAKIIGALIYPIVILGVLLLAVVLMMTLVIPKMMDFFTQSGKALPLPTQILISASEFMQSYWMILVVGIAIIVAGIIAWRKTVTGRYQWDQLILKIPLVGALLKKGILADFARLLSDMLGSGVPVVQSLKIIANAIGNEVYRQRILLAAQDVEQGIPLAETINDAQLFPVILINMVEIGEQTAHLDTVTEKIAALYDEEVDAAVKGLTKAFEPILLIFIGVVVGSMVAAIMLPIMDMSNIGTT